MNIDRELIKNEKYRLSFNWRKNIHKTSLLKKPIYLAILLGILLLSDIEIVNGQNSTSEPNLEQTSEQRKKNLTILPPVSLKNKDEEKLTEQEQQLLQRLEKLEKRLQDLEKNSLIEDTKQNSEITTSENIVLKDSEKLSEKQTTDITKDDRETLKFFQDTTINFSVDGYYNHNFNRPYNRLNLLRAYDQSSKSFTLGQANVVIENAPNVEKGKRFGFRLDLQFGQATQTVQGNSANESRPEIYRPVWQAYGTYVAPIGKGLTLDFGKFAGSLGYETNYTKDNFNYSRSFFFNYLPYYHMGLRASYPITDKLTATYWLVNGAQQTEDFNSSKSQAILLTYKPTKKIILQGNYYVGREQRDQEVADSATPPNFDITRGIVTPQGRFHVFDAYATFLLTDKLTLAVEGDYVINRFNKKDAPSRVSGGAAYLRYQMTPKFAFAGRTEYLSDQGGLFSGTTQSLKEFTLTGEYKFAEGFLLRGEYRRDWSNRPYFLTNDLNILKKEQNTATVGFVWWVGRKQGAW